MVGSAFIIESVFAWPGIGRLTVNAVQQRDFLVVQGCVLVIAVGFVVINLLVDLLYAAIDPRVRAHA
jgi:peptide/nickel transport system permease protein